MYEYSVSTAFNAFEPPMSSPGCGLPATANPAKVKGLLRSLHLGRDFAKDWIIFLVYFCSERKPQASEYWLSNPTPNFCQDMKSTL